jgi:hypothetical protein
MNKLTRILLIITPCLNLSLYSPAQEKAEKINAYVGIHVVPMDRERLIENQTVIVRDGKITEIGDADKVKVPVNATVIPSKGLFMMPGLTDMHAHLPSFPEKEGEINVHDYLLLNVMRGVTSIRGMRGDPEQLAWRDSIAKHQLIGPRLFLASPVLPSQDNLNAHKAGELLDKYKKEGYDFVKYLYPLRTSCYDSVMRMAQEKGVKVAGHCPEGGLEAAIRDKQASVEHLDGFLDAYKKDTVHFHDLMRQMATAGLFACPDYQWYYVYWDQLSLQQMKMKEGVNILPAKVVNAWIASFDKSNAERIKDKAAWMKKKNAHRIELEQAMKMLKGMNDDGVPLLTSAGDGAFIVPGYSVMDECRNFTDAGMSPYETLKAATVNAASFFGESGSWGTLGPGKRADMLILEENPLLNIENLNTIKGVVLDGTWLPKEELDRMGQEMKDRNLVSK